MPAGDALHAIAAGGKKRRDRENEHEPAQTRKGRGWQRAAQAFPAFSAVAARSARSRCARHSATAIESPASGAMRSQSRWPAGAA